MTPEIQKAAETERSLVEALRWRPNDKALKINLAATRKWLEMLREQLIDPPQK